VSTRATLAAGAIVLAAGIVLIALVAGPRQGGGSPAGAASPSGSSSASPSAGPTASPPAALLGTRADAIAFFEDRGFSGELSQTTDGRPRWIAVNDAEHAVRVSLIGPADAVHELELVVVLTGATSRDAGRLLGQTLQSYAPDAAEWVADNLAAARAGEAPGEQFGPLTVSLDAIAGRGGTVVTLTIDYE
jgi:hypothetical protein